MNGYAGLSFDEDRLTIRPAKGFAPGVSEMFLRSVSFWGARFSIRLSSRRVVTMCILDSVENVIFELTSREGMSAIEKNGECSQQKADPVISIKPSRLSSGEEGVG